MGTSISIALLKASSTDRHTKISALYPGLKLQELMSHSRLYSKYLTQCMAKVGAFIPMLDR
jgi:hypothetical protein